MRAPDSSSVIGYVKTSENALGIVCMSDYMQDTDDLKLIYSIPPEEVKPIIYSATQLLKADHAETAKQFLDFLLSNEGHSILEEHGLHALEENR